MDGQNIITLWTNYFSHLYCVPCKWIVEHGIISIHSFLDYYPVVKVGASGKAGGIHMQPNRKVEICYLHRYVIRDLSGTGN